MIVKNKKSKQRSIAINEVSVLDKVGKLLLSINKDQNK